MGEKKRRLSKSITVEMEAKIDRSINLLLNESETFLERNMNAAANNMSLLTLHAFEFENHIEQ